MNRFRFFAPLLLFSFFTLTTETQAFDLSDALQGLGEVIEDGASAVGETLEEGFKSLGEALDELDKPSAESISPQSEAEDIAEEKNPSNSSAKRESTEDNFPELTSQEFPKQKSSSFPVQSISEKESKIEISHLNEESASPRSVDQESKEKDVEIDDLKDSTISSFSVPIEPKVVPQSNPDIKIVTDGKLYTVGEDIISNDTNESAIKGNEELVERPAEEFRANNGNITRTIKVMAKDKDTGKEHSVELYRKSYAVIIGIDQYKNLS